jgi:glycosyltransferase involved in cell wall biosynthesis
MKSSAGASPHPVLSFVIPTHGDRAAETFRLAKAILEEPGEDFEVVVVDDCSPRDPTELFSQISDRRFTFQRNPINLGLVQNWNRCADVARGEWINIFHSDDMLLPGAVDVIRTAIQGHPEAGMLCALGLDGFEDGRIVDRNGDYPTTAALYAPGFAAGRFLFAYPFYPSAVVISRRAYDKVGYFDIALKYSPDEEMWPRVGASFPVIYVPRATVVYRRTRNNEMYPSWSRDDFVAVYRDTLERALEHYSALPQAQQEELNGLATRRLRRNWMILAFLCLQAGKKSLARDYLEESRVVRRGTRPTGRELFVQGLAWLPAPLARLACGSITAILTHWLPWVGRRLLPR